MSDYLLVDGPGIWAFQVNLKPGKSFLIGRSSESDLRLPDAKVSGRHCQLRFDDGAWILQDLQSSNGTLVNGESVQERRLRDGDAIRVGGTDLVLHAPSLPDDGEKKAWEQTQVLIARQEQAVRGAIKKASPREMVITSEIHLPSAASAPPPAQARRQAAPPAAPEPPTPPGGKTSTAPGPAQEEDFVFQPERYITSAPAGADAAAAHAESLWVAERLADVLADLAACRAPDLDSFFHRALTRVREAIVADNGFLMIPDKASKRWVIRAWVGDASAWTQYERERPVPLTIANQAFQTGKVVSNAFDEPGTPNPSESQIMLQIFCYIAVPLTRNGKSEGLLYFDSRRSLRVFQPRDVKLLERVGAYLVEAGLRQR